MMDRRAVVRLIATVSCLFHSRRADAQTQPPRPTGTSPLTGTRWLVEEIDAHPATPIPDGQSGGLPVVSFPASGGIWVVGCNNFATSLIHDGGTGLSFTSNWPRTMMACRPEAHRQDERLNVAVKETTSFRQQGDHLWFLDRRGAERLRLKRTTKEFTRP